MSIPTRTLSVGLTGADVADLQTHLGQLAFAVPAAEQQGSSFGQGTHDAVAQFQTASGLPATGVVDSATATAIGLAVAEATYTVTGSVFSPTRIGVGGLNVQLVDKNVGADVPLGTATTDASGVYIATAVVSVPSLLQRNKKNPDLQVVVSAGTNVLATSSVVYNAPASVTLNVVLRPDVTAAERVRNVQRRPSRPPTPGRSPRCRKRAAQDITYLANKTGVDAPMVRSERWPPSSAKLPRNLHREDRAPHKHRHRPRRRPVHSLPRRSAVPPASAVPGAASPAPGDVLPPAGVGGSSTPTPPTAGRRRDPARVLLCPVPRLPANADTLYRAAPKPCRPSGSRRSRKASSRLRSRHRFPPRSPHIKRSSATNALAAKSLIGVSGTQGRAPGLADRPKGTTAIRPVVRPASG